ncbi:hypothetical protein [Tuwongella immobilis]|uniref:Uncharacterized protein n=1 Tax=Tuwongella immobilis TaxID=692036 RepID=A0A6C2YM39_9BACT|nr:hypothetical protein [Tuwongella immobilis]VIP02658.1 Uncharacterized protein OS=Pirellula staleyi (strain ATCC 27377 / DSM 6068 / ICPB 4128) GN=Psta_1272 PE=4 SV=1 [Tuwongella immobilis]VTS02063.1 Uncharacterized protein OS=Pirellula staleyi (strain ATCC 27377 / DSM 6068 / ICPB 4128) GN=Psta_1272 PE=4 SV=1 [Tuwongella immobilis]
MMIPTQMIRARRAIGFGLVALAVTLLSGCGGSDVVSVSGKVTYNGKPVTGGSLTFLPVASGESKEAGKPGGAVIQSDGTFVVGTHSENDGAIPGKHKVSFTPPEMPYPEGKDPKPGQARPKSGFERLVVKTSEIEIKSSTSNLEIELVMPGR